MAEARRRRLALRPLGPEDFEQLRDAVEISRELLRRRLGEEHPVFEGKGFIERSSEALRRGEAAAWGVFEARGGTLVGVARLLGLKGPAELEGWIREDRQDRGYGAEAARAALEQGFGKLALHRVWARIDPLNRGARKALRRAGFRYEGRLRAAKRLNGRWVDQECWGALRKEWSR